MQRTGKLLAFQLAIHIEPSMWPKIMNNLTTIWWQLHVKRASRWLYLLRECNSYSPSFSWFLVFRTILSIKCSSQDGQANLVGELLAAQTLIFGESQRGWINTRWPRTRNTKTKTTTSTSTISRNSTGTNSSSPRYYRLHTQYIIVQTTGVHS